MEKKSADVSLSEMSKNTSGIMILDWVILSFLFLFLIIFKCSFAWQEDKRKTVVFNMNMQQFSAAGLTGVAAVLVFAWEG